MAFEYIRAQPIEVKDAAHLRARLRRVVRGHAVDQARKLRRLVLLDPDWFDGQWQTPQPEPRCYRLEQLKAAMATLRPGERQILQWRYGEGLGCAEIAARLGVPLRSAQREVAVSRQRLIEAKKVEKSWRVLAGSNVLHSAKPLFVSRSSRENYEMARDHDGLLGMGRTAPQAGEPPARTQTSRWSDGRAAPLPGFIMHASIRAFLRSDWLRYVHPI